MEARLEVHASRFNFAAKFTRDPLLAWRSRECQEFYAESAPRAAPPGLRFDASSGLFMPPRRGRSTPIKRMRTREDTLDVAHCRLRAADAGALHVPIDKWLGTYAGSKADLKRIWTRPEEKVGREGNDTPVHAAG